MTAVVQYAIFTITISNMRMFRLSFIIPRTKKNTNLKKMIFLKNMLGAFCANCSRIQLKTVDCGFLVGFLGYSGKCEKGWQIVSCTWRG